MSNIRVQANFIEGTNLARSSRRCEYKKDDGGLPTFIELYFFLISRRTRAGLR